MKYLVPFLFFFFYGVNALFAQNTNKVIITFDHKVGNAPLVLDQTVFPIWNSRKLKITRAQFYLSELELKRADGSVLPLTDKYLLVTAGGTNQTFELGSYEVSSITETTLHTGVPKSVNHNDPSLWPNHHPLALQVPSMHWGWAGGYRFMAIEGKADLDNNGEPETLFEYHNLGDVLYKAAQVSSVRTAQNGELRINVAVDYIKLFNNLAMKSDLVQHGSSSYNTVMTNNAANAGFFTVNSASSADDLEANSLNIKVLPNPTSDFCHIRYELPASVTELDFVLYNAIGQEVQRMSSQPQSGLLPVETSALPNGLYQAVFVHQGKTLARKAVLVQR